MSVDVSPSDLTTTAGSPSLRTEGVARLTVERLAGESIAMDINEQGPLRLRFPRVRAGDGLEAIIVNIGGGIVGGDQLAFEIEACEGASVSVTSQAAEKIYRSNGADASVSVRLSSDRNAELVWLPQESILFDRARVRRRIEADAKANSSLTICESVVFGRAAMGEQVVSGLITDHWRVRRDGTLVFAEALALDGAIGKILQGPAIGRGAVAFATLVHLAPDAESKIDAIRASQTSTVEAGASAFSGLLVARFLAADAFELRAAILSAVSALGVVAPRAFSL
jgi:urease accessory protein